MLVKRAVATGTRRDEAAEARTREPQEKAAPRATMIVSLSETSR